jgi:hypothetical protein
MAPFKSSLARSAGKLFGVFKEADLSLRGATFSDRYVVPPLTATGGTTNTGGGYKYHIYSSDTPAPESNFTVTSGDGGNIELLVIGGGGGSSFDNGGGGGAGGIAYASALSVTQGAHAISVGGGGQGSSTFGYPGHPNNNPTRGTNSTFVHPAGTITGLGGGGPAAETPNYEVYTPVPSNVYPGGSSGGGRYTYPGKNPLNIDSVTAAQPSQPNFGVGVVHYGNIGGNANQSSFTGGGGGGAGGAGSPKTPSSPGAGGPGQPFTGFSAPMISPGIPSPEQSAFISAVGPTGLFGGGGGGSSETVSGDSPVAPGGGGKGGLSVPDAAGAGVYGTGGGGGSHNSAGKNGGTGLVILRYQV